MIDLPRLQLDAPVWLLDLLTHLWQSTVVAVAVLLLLTACARLSARTRQMLGWIAIAKFVVPAAWFGTLAERITGAPKQWLVSEALMLPVNWSAQALAVERPAAIWSAPAWLGPMLAGSWLVGALVLIAGWLVRGIRLRRRLLDQARPVPPAVARMLERAAAQVGLRNVPHCLIVENDHGPGAVGIISPMLILPFGLAETLAGAELEAILVHECVHLLRRDNWWGALRAAFVGLLWFNPIAWLLNRAIAIETEKSCDERVLEITGDADAYARGIVASVRHTLGVAQPGLSAVTTPPVLARLENILTHQARPDRPVLRWAAVLAGIGLAAFSGRAGSISAVPPRTVQNLVAAASATPERAGLPAATQPPADAVTMSVDFQDEDIRTILRNVADLYQLNVVIPDAVRGRTTIKLHDVTWRQIFKAALEPIGFGFVEENRVVTLAPQDAAQKPASYRIGTITIRLNGVTSITEQEVRSKLQTREGGDFNETILDRDIRALYRTGLFELIEVKHEPAGGAAFNLVFQIKPKPTTVNGQVDRQSQKSANSTEVSAPPGQPEPASDRPPALTLGQVEYGDWGQPKSAPKYAAEELRKFFEGPLVEPATLVRQVAPRYPDAARATGEEGRVELALLIDTSGTVAGAKVLSSSDPVFEGPALEAVKKWAYTPMKMDGKITLVTLKVPVVFPVPPSTTPTTASAGRSQALAPGDEQGGADLGPSYVFFPVSPPSVPQPEKESVYRGMRVFAVDALDQAPLARFQARPRYPFQMRRDRIGGEAVVDFIVDANGEVVNARAIRSSRQEFEAPAVEAVGKWKFKPGQKAGRPVPTHMQVPVVFKVNEE